ncbi:hypothetical protein [Streptomyces sp. NPDC051546]
MSEEQQTSPANAVPDPAEETGTDSVVTVEGAFNNELPPMLVIDV